MGYASYYENINDRIADLNHRVLAPSLREVATVARGAQAERAETLIREARVIEERIRNLRDELLDLATHPDVQLAFEVAQARNRLEQLGGRLTRQDAAFSDQSREQELLRHELASERRRRQVAERNQRTAERELEAVCSSDPQAMERLLDRYSPSVVGAR